MKKLLCMISAAILSCFILTGCGKGEKKNDAPPVIGENGVGELITPDEESEEASLGSYRFDENGIKLYYEEDDVSTELMKALTSYFLSLQNKDLEAYKSCLFPDYAERYNTYLEENLDYSIDKSFEVQCENIRNFMIDELYGSYDAENTEDYTGDFKITRIRAERYTPEDESSEEDVVKTYFQTLDSIFQTDYYSLVSEQSDAIEYLTFFVIAEGEDGEEHRIISDFGIVFVLKDGKYYTFG